MRTLILTVAAAMAVIAAPALAQNAAGSSSGTPDSQSSSSPGASSTGPNYGSSNTARTGTRAPTSGIVPDQPSSWSGSAADWSTHAQACASRYSSYDASTDMYTDAGKSQRCMLSMGGASSSATSRNSGKTGSNTDPKP